MTFLIIYLSQFVKMLNCSWQFNIILREKLTDVLKYWFKFFFFLENFYGNKKATNFKGEICV